MQSSSCLTNLISFCQEMPHRKTPHRIVRTKLAAHGLDKHSSGG